MPDDPVKDKVTWRNGRVINNVFVPDEAMVPEPVNVRQQPSQLPRQPKQFDFDDFYKGREPKRRMRDNMAIESRSDQVYVKPPAGFNPTVSSIQIQLKTFETIFLSILALSAGFQRVLSRLSAGSKRAIRGLSAAS